LPEGKHLYPLKSSKPVPPVSGNLNKTKMKKFITTLATGMFLLFVIPVHAEVTRPEKISVSKTEIVESPEITLLVNRVNEIKEMDKSTLSFSEKRELRSELRDIKKEVNRRSGSVIYVSTGLILLIILLIILL
jgi:hypothetical protein